MRGRSCIRAFAATLLVASTAAEGWAASPQPTSGWRAPAFVGAVASTPRGGSVTTRRSSNGRIVFGRWSSAATSDIFSVRPNGSGLKRLTFTGAGWYPAWSPDGRRIAFTGRDNAIWIMRADGSRPRQVTHPGTADQAPCWSPNGVWIAFDRFKAATPPTVIFVVRTDGSDLRRLRGGLDPAWSPDGRLIAFTGTDGIWVMRPNGRGARRVLSGDASQPAWSPNGARLAFTWELDIWLVKADGTGLRHLATGKAVDQTPAWSPDGRRIAFSRNRAIWTIGADGKGARKVTRPGERADATPDW